MQQSAEYGKMIKLGYVYCYETNTGDQNKLSLFVRHKILPFKILQIENTSLEK